MQQDISYKNIFRIAIPISLSGIGHVAIQAADTIFIGRLGEVELGAVNNAGILYFICAMVGMGFSTGAQIIMGRRNGEGNYGEIGKTWSQVVYFLIPLALLFFGFLKFLTPPLLDAINESGNIVAKANEYLGARSWGIFFTFMNTAFLAFYVGITRTRVLILGMGFMATLNILLDYALIFGAWGFPEMGVEGAALASAISEGATTVFNIVYTIIVIDLKKYQLFKLHKPTKAIILNTLNVGGPIMLQNFITMTSWFVFFSIIERIGERELAISAIVRTVYMVLMMPSWGFGSAANTLSSNLIGQGDTNLVMKMAGRAILLGFVANLIMVQLGLWIPETILNFFTKDPTLAADAVPTMYVVCGAMFLFATAIILFQTLTGTGKTWLSLLLEVINIVFYLAACYLLVIHWHAGVEIAWTTEYIYFGLLGTMSFIYLKTGRWKSSNI